MLILYFSMKGRKFDLGKADVPNQEKLNHKEIIILACVLVPMLPDAREKDNRQAIVPTFSYSDQRILPAKTFNIHQVQHTTYTTQHTTNGCLIYFSLV